MFRCVRLCSGFGGDEWMNETENQAETENIIDTIKPTIIETLASSSQAREDLRRHIKREIGIDVEPYMERAFGELPDKKISVSESDIPMREIAETVYELMDDGYNNSQISSQLGLWPVEVTRILKDRKNWEKQIWKVAVKGLPLHLRTLAKLKNLLG